MAFQSKQYSWANVEIVMMGRPVIGARNVEYTSSKEKEHLHARGEDPISIQSGNKSYEGTITVLQSELHALEDAAGAGNDIGDLPAFDIVVAYIPKEGTPIRTDIIKNVEFTEDAKGMSQGDKFMEIELPFLALAVEKNV